MTERRVVGAFLIVSLDMSRSRLSHTGGSQGRDQQCSSQECGVGKRNGIAAFGCGSMGGKGRSLRCGEALAS